MVDKKKAAEGFGTPAASNKLSSLKHSIRTTVKAAIVRFALRRVVSPAVAEWLIRKGGLRHV